jgi:hypothetical protein
MKKKLLHITGRHIYTGKSADFYFYSIKQAKYFNPMFTDWEERGVARE